MQDLPHHYRIMANAASEGNVSISGEKLETLQSAPPEEFGGPGDRWSPETLLVAALADCFILTFRAIARASKLSWLSLSCEVEGILDRSERVVKFTEFTVKATLKVPSDSKEANAMRILEKAEQSCLITNSLSGTTHFDPMVIKDKP